MAVAFLERMPTAKTLPITLMLAMAAPSLAIAAPAKLPGAVRRAIVKDALRGYTSRKGDYDNPGTALTADPHTRADWNALKSRFVPTRIRPARAQRAALGSFFDGFVVQPSAREMNQYRVFSLPIGVAGRFDYGTYQGIVNVKTKEVYWLGQRR